MFQPKKLCICLARWRRKVSDCGVSNTKRRFLHAGRWDLLLSTKGTALPRKWTDKNLVRKSRKILLTISEILQHLSNRTKHASEKCNERVGNDCPVLRIPVGSNPMASSSWTSRARELQHRHASLGHIPSQAAQGLSTQHRLGQADGQGPQEEGEQWAGRGKPWNNPKSPSQRPAATGRVSEQSPGWQQLAITSGQSTHVVQYLPQLSHGAFGICWGWVTDKHLSPVPCSPHVKKKPCWQRRGCLCLRIQPFFFLIHAI